MPDLYTITLELRMLMGALSKVSHQALEQRLLAQDIELSRLQYGILRVLDYEGAHTISDLSRKFSLDPSTFVPAADALERKGLISRERDPNDRRRFPLSLTEAGRTLAKEIVVVTDDDPILNSLNALGAEHTAQLLDLLRDLIRNLPEGEAMLSNVQARIYAEEKTHGSSC